MRDAYQSLSEEERIQVIALLNSLVLFRTLEDQVEQEEQAPNG